MAAKAFVLIETAVGKAKKVAASLGQIKGIKSVDLVTWPYDIIATLEAATLSSSKIVLTRSAGVSNLT